MEETKDPQQGQSIVIVAVGMLALIIFVAISLDVGSAYVGRRTAQNAADGAAAAGARRLAYQINYGPFSDEWIKRDMNDIGERNGVLDTGGAPGDATNDNVDGWYLDESQSRIGVVGAGTVPADAWGIEAVTYITTPAFLGGVLGFEGYPLQAEAAVMLDWACGQDCVLPIATHLRNLTMTAPCFEIYNGTDPGDFGWLNWDNQPEAVHCGVDEQCVEANLNPDACNSGLIQVGDWVSATAGVKTAAKDTLAIWLEPGREVTTIVWDVTKGPGGTNVAYHVAGFARLRLIGFKLAAGGGNMKVAEWFDGDPAALCIPSSVGDPEDKNIIWAEFLGFVDGTSGGSCRAVGTVRAPVFVK